jgi:ATP-dependent helicase/nuclease subunit A
MGNSILKLEASAGSGKTYRLALEYLGRLLLAFAGAGEQEKNERRQRESLGSILAITFTVKAAQEMKDRILKKLKAFALGSESHPLKREDEEFLGLLANKTRLSKNKIVELSGKLIELVLARYDDFNVTTIDSLMSAMVKAVSPDLDLPADYEIAVDAGDEMESCGRAMLARLADDDWPRLEHFLEDLRRISPKVAWKTDDMIIAMVSTLFRRTLQQGEAGPSPTPAGLRSQMAASWRGFKEKLRPLFALLPEKEPDGKKRRYASGTYLKDPLLEQMAAALEEGDDLFRLEGFIKSTFFRKPDPQELLIKDTPTEHRERFACAYRPAQEALRDAVLDFSAFKALPYREFLGNFGAQWREDKKTLFVEEFSYTLAKLFDRWRDEAFPYLYLKLSDRFRNFLFDEFQDTSTLQFKALAPLIDEVLSRDKHASLFIVGDRKQAVYRWRGGNSELMEEDRLREEVPAIDNLNRSGFSSSLGVNWRSRREIVGFNNDFWNPENISRIAAENELQQAIGKNFKDSQQELPAGEARKGGYVELSLQIEAEAGREDEAGETETPEDAGGALSAAHLDAIERTVCRLHDEHGYDYSDIAVLVRKNDQIRAVIRRLGRNQISSVSDQSLLLSANVRVAEIIAFLRFLDYPPDDLNFFAFISGRVFGVAAANLFPIEMKAFSARAFIGCRGPFYKLFQEKFPESWKRLIEPFFQSAGFLPPYDLFADITQVFNVFENFPEDTPFFMALGDALHRAERDGGSSIAGFVRLWQRMVGDGTTPSVAIPENTPGVRVLTMHQSKGLEFPVVIVPVSDSGGRGDDNLHWDREGLFYVTGGIAQAHPALKDKYQKENIRGSIDLLNLLYVAFTRAQEALFVPVAVKRAIKAPETDESSLVKRISRASDAIGRHPLLAWFDEDRERFVSRGKLERKERKPQREAPPVPIRSKRVLTRSWQSKYLVFKQADAKQRRDRPEAKRGDRVHDLLSRLGGITGPQELDARVRNLAAAAGWPASDIQAVSSYLVRDDVFRLMSQGREIHLEKEIVVNAGGSPKTLRLDRLQAGPEEVQVIDFKTGREKSDAYDGQMREYLAAVGPLFPGRKCRGFLLYIDRGEIEEIPCSN